MTKKQHEKYDISCAEVFQRYSFSEARGDKLRIRLKLMAVLALITVIPLIIVCTASDKAIKSDNYNYLLRSMNYAIKSQAEDINSICSDVISEAKNISVSRTIADYVAATTGSDYVLSLDDPSYKEVMHDLEIFSKDSTIIKTMLINNSGIVVASTANDDSFGKKLPNYKELLGLAVKNNGVSGFSMFDENNRKALVFTVSKVIYSSTNEKVGIVYIVLDTQNLQKFVNNIQTDKYTIVSLMDSEGNVLEYPFKTITHYSNANNYSAYTEKLNCLFLTENNSKFIETLVSDSSGKKNFYASPVGNTGWYLVASTEISGIRSLSSKSGSSVVTLTISICIAVLIIIFFISERFVRPVKKLLETINEKQKGNNSARFDESSGDEFAIVGHSFNTMLDSISESEQRYRTIVEMTNNITFEINYKRNTVFVSKNFNKKFSFRAKDDSLKESFIYKVRVHKDDKDRYLNDMDRILGPKANFIQGEYRIKSIYGDFIWVMIKATKFFDRNETPSKIIGVIVDIDREKKSEMHLLQRANYDNLTQLYNRESFLKAVTDRLSTSMYKKSLDAVMFIDLDDFKYFNDEFGHACGDEVLKFVADTLKEITFERGFAGRFGGDEFVACITDFALFGDAGKIAQEIIDILGNGFISESTNKRLYIKCSIGIAFLFESGKTTNEVIAAADEAMYNIKKHGKSSYAYAKSASKNAKNLDVVAPTTSSIDSDNIPSNGGSSSRYQKPVPEPQNDDKPEESKPSIEVDANFFNPLF